MVPDQYRTYVCMYSSTQVVLLKSVNKVLTSLMSMSKLPLTSVRPELLTFFSGIVLGQGKGGLFWFLPMNER